jgi:hypothetical protein
MIFILCIVIPLISLDFAFINLIELNTEKISEYLLEFISTSKISLLSKKTSEKHFKRNLKEYIDFDMFEYESYVTYNKCVSLTTILDQGKEFLV